MVKNSVKMFPDPRPRADYGFLKQLDDAWVAETEAFSCHFATRIQVAIWPCTKPNKLNLTSLEACGIENFGLTLGHFFG